MPKRIKIGLFEAFETSGQTLVKNLQDVLKHYCLTKKILAYVKDEGFSLNTMIIM